jgi:hypothetical protein
MQPKPTKPSFTKMFLATLLGFVLGLGIGIAVEYFGNPHNHEASKFETTDRFGAPHTLYVTGRTPAYIILPAVGASIGFLWLLALRISRAD